MSTTPTDRPLRADARRNRAKIVDAAREVFAETGLEAQMDDVARRAEVGVGTLYRHFPTKDALVRAVIVDKMERLAEAGREIQARDDDPWSALQAFLWSAASAHAADRALSQVLSTQPAQAFREAAREETDLFAVAGELLGRAQEAGVARADALPDDIPTIMCGLSAVLESDREGCAWKRYMTLALDGLRKAGPAPLPEK